MKRSKRIRLLGIYLILMILSTFCDAIFYDNHWLVAVFSSTLNIFTAAFFYLLGSIPTSEKIENNYIFELENNIKPVLTKKIKHLRHHFTIYPGRFLSGQDKESKRDKIYEDIIQNRQDIFMPIDNWAVSVYSSLSNGQISGKLLYEKEFKYIKHIISEFHNPLICANKRVYTLKKKLKSQGDKSKVIGAFYQFSNLKNLVLMLRKKNGK